MYIPKSAWSAPEISYLTPLRLFYKKRHFWPKIRGSSGNIYKIPPKLTIFPIFSCDYGKMGDTIHGYLFVKVKREFLKNESERDGK